MPTTLGATILISADESFTVFSHLQQCHFLANFQQTTKFEDLQTYLQAMRFSTSVSARSTANRRVPLYARTSQGNNTAKFIVLSSWSLSIIYEREVLLLSSFLLIRVSKWRDKFGYKALLLEHVWCVLQASTS
jgi:hypothetical protein